MLLVSGLGLGGGGGESLLGTQLLVDVVTGQLGDEGEQCSAAHVSRVILAGNLLSHSTQSRDSINKVGHHLPAAALLPCVGHRVLQFSWAVPNSDAGATFAQGPSWLSPCLLSPAGGLCSAPSPVPQAVAR